jgi:hypothetical protein
MHSDIEDLHRQLEAAAHDADAVTAGLTEAQGAWRASAHTWSVAQCLDHLAATNRIYLKSMRPAAAEARKQGRFRRGPAKPGLFGRLFVRNLEPPVKSWPKVKAPKSIEPRPSPPLTEAHAAFTAVQDEVRAFLRECADLDLPAVEFPNPFIRGLRVSLATALHAIAAHERRHLWQAWNVRRAAPASAATTGRG